jgi:hypothetical protein
MMSALLSGASARRRLVARAESLAVAAEDPELEAAGLGQPRQHRDVAAAVRRPLLGDDEHLGGAAGLSGQPLDRRRLRVVQPRGARTPARRLARHVARGRPEPSRFRFSGERDVGDVLVERHA